MVLTAGRANRKFTIYLYPVSISISWLRRLLDRANRRTEPKAKACEEGSLVAEARLSEHVGGIIRNCVDTAKLLHEHHDEGGNRRATVSRDTEEFLVPILPAIERLFRLKQDMNIFNARILSC